MINPEKHGSKELELERKGPLISEIPERLKSRKQNSKAGSNRMTLFFRIIVLHKGSDP